MCELYFGFECAVHQTLVSADILGPLMIVAMAGGVVVPPILAVLSVGYNIARGGNS